MCGLMGSKLTLSNELRRLVGTRIEHTLDGIEDTLRCILKKQEMSLEDLKPNLQSLEESFSLLSQKWSLEILYTLFLKSARAVSANSRRYSESIHAHFQIN